MHKLLDVLINNRYLKSIFACVAAPRENDRLSVKVDLGVVGNALHKSKRVEVTLIITKNFFNQALGFLTLNCNKGSVFLILYRDVFSLKFCIFYSVDVLKVCILACTVEDYIEVIIIKLGNYAVVLDSAAGEHKHTKRCLSVSLYLSINNSNAFEKVFSVLASKAHLAHMRYVKNTDALPAVKMLSNAASGVIYGHVVTSEGNNSSLHNVLVEVI